MSFSRTAFIGSPVHRRLIAETGSAFICAIAGIETELTERNTAYLRHWISALKQDNKLMVQAAASSQRAVDMITGTTFELARQ
jgi:antirestriction protein ArdC